MIVLEAGPARAEVRPDHGGRVGSLVVDGRELLVTEAEGAAEGPMYWGLFPMAPWAGRTRHGHFTFDGRDYDVPCNLPPHAIHGTVFDRRWPDAASDDGSSVTLQVELGPRWPFAGTVTHDITLTPESLSLRLVVETTVEAMPAACGWHPWWRRSIDDGTGRAIELEVALDVTGMYRRDDEGLPDGTVVTPPAAGPFDDCFTGIRTPPRLTWRDVLDVELDTTCEDVVLYDERPYATCLEPQTHPPDALNLGAARVEPGRPLVAEATWCWPPPPGEKRRKA